MAVKILISSWCVYLCFLVKVEICYRCWVTGFFVPKNRLVHVPSPGLRRISEAHFLRMLSPDVSSYCLNFVMVPCGRLPKVYGGEGFEDMRSMVMHTECPERVIVDPFSTFFCVRVSAVGV